MHQTSSIVCGSCGAIVDISDENFKILDSFLAKARYTPLIPLGTKGVIRGVKWQVIGFIRRCITVDGVGYRWSEYLLFNPYKGFRWLTEYNGHWNYVRQVMERPQVFSSGNISYHGAVFKHFQQAQATVEYVLGEFYWRVQKDDACWVSDFVAPPLMLSVEKTDKEATWSLGEYISSQEIEQSFQLQKKLPARIGVYANQPSPYTGATKRTLRTALTFGAIATLMQILFVVVSQNKLVLQQRFSYNPAAAEKSVVTDVFDVGGRRSNVVVRSSALVNNAWIFLNMALINDEDGTAYDLGREIGYYSGTDSDGPWTEGSQTDSVTIPSVPAGRYFLRVEPEGDVGVNYAIAVYRDVPSWTYFLVTILLLMVVPAITLVRRLSFENRRWAESDHPWVRSSDD
jgi:hypothetical protein